MTRTDELIWIEAMEGLHTTHISAGAWHSVALTGVAYFESGDVYVWGWNHMGQLGSDKSETELYPSPLELDQSAVMIAAQGNKTFLWLVEESEENMVVMGSDKCGKPASDTTLTL
uniref:Regulator of chromosome condensation (RCC1) family protein n=1 Tax=Heterorhabditis bacteriophora TaxID=37862 RepID=A0A1I7X1Y0_HETBA